MSKLSQDLRRRLDALAAGETVEVVVEVGGKSASPEPVAGDRAQRMAALKSAFSASAEPIERAIERCGGQVLDRAWLTQSLKARLPREAVETIGEREDVERVDTPRALQAD
jgi:hypothetical protein